MHRSMPPEGQQITSRPIECRELFTLSHVGHGGKQMSLPSHGVVLKGQVSIEHRACALIDSEHLMRSNRCGRRSLHQRAMTNQQKRYERDGGIELSNGNILRLEHSLGRKLCAV